MNVEHGVIKSKLNSKSHIYLEVQYFRWIGHNLDVSNPDSKDHGAEMGPTWVLSAPVGPHVGTMNLAIKEVIIILPIKIKG